MLGLGCIYKFRGSMKVKEFEGSDCTLGSRHQTLRKASLVPRPIQCFKSACNIEKLRTGLETRLYTAKRKLLLFVQVKRISFNNIDVSCLMPACMRDLHCTCQCKSTSIFIAHMITAQYKWYTMHAKV